MNVLFIGGMDLTIHPNHRAHHFIAFLESLGMRVDIVSMTPFYSGPRPSRPWSRFWRGLLASLRHPFVVETRQTGVEVAIRRLPSWLDAFVQTLWAYVHLGPLAEKRYKICIFGNPDNVLLPLLLKKNGHVKTIIYDDWDFYPGFNRSKLWNLLTRYREQLCISLAEVVISVGSMLSELRKGQGATRALVIPNGVNYRMFAVAQEKGPHQPTLIYSGRLDEDWGVEVSLEGFAIVRNRIPDAKYLIIGYNEGSYPNYLKSLVKQLNLEDNVVFVGSRRYEELPHYMAEADIGVALHKPNKLMMYAFPLKVVEYMAAGLAVVGTGIGETEKLIRESQAGTCVAYSAVSFSGAVIDIFKDRNVLAHYCENAKEFAKLYDWAHLFSDLANLDILRRQALPACANGQAY